MPTPVLTLREVSKSFRAARPLRDVHLALVPGDARALVGENGAGKSTLVKIKAGAATPDSGEIRLREYYAQRTLLKREVLPVHVANAVLVLTAGELGHNTGTPIPVDAGVSAAFLR